MTDHFSLTIPDDHWAPLNGEDPTEATAFWAVIELNGNGFYRGVALEVADEEGMQVSAGGYGDDLTQIRDLLDLPDEQGLSTVQVHGKTCVVIIVPLDEPATE